MLDVGDAAPEFALPNQADERRTLSDFADGPLVVYFFPRAQTNGCTIEANGFNDHIDDFADRSVSVVGISDDPVTDLAAFTEAEDLHFDLLSDEHGEVATLYDSYGTKQLYGNTFEGVYRNTYILDGAGVVLETFEDVSPRGHAADILEWFDEQRRAVMAND